ncbi:MAG: hypothetical protein A3C03_00920, partial [Candidatus Colwellbacteria bacterium RIFCSPHIGHO2_02_FULL_45_17]
SSPDTSASKEPSAEGGATEVAGSGETPQAEVESVEETVPETPAVEASSNEVEGQKEAPVEPEAKVEESKADE